MAPVNSCQHLRGLWTPSGQILDPVIGRLRDASAQMTSELNHQQLALSQTQIHFNWPLTKA